jgi:hypothetical protein
MLPKRPLDSQKPNGTRRISASPSRMLSCLRVTRNSGSPTHTRTHTSEAKLGTPPLSHMISLCLVYCGPSVTCWSHTRPHRQRSRQRSRSPRRVPSLPGALSYFHRWTSHLTSTPFSRWPWAEREAERCSHSLSRAREPADSSRGSAADVPLRPCSPSWPSSPRACSPSWPSWPSSRSRSPPQGSFSRA